MALVFSSPVLRMLYLTGFSVLYDAAHSNAAVLYEVYLYFSTDTILCKCVQFSLLL
jgi:hypothetical protein